MTAPQIHLASKSPRRQQLLRQLGIDFDVLKLREAAGRDRDIVEGARDAEPPLHYVERMARTKVGAGWQRMHQRKLPERPVLSADTEVVQAIREVARGGRYVHPELGARLVSAETEAARRAE